MKENSPINFQQINFIYLALIMGQVSIFAIFLFLKQGEEAIVGSTLNYVSAILSVSCITIAFMLLNKHKADAEAITVEEDKWEHYRKTSLLRWALLEGANLTALICFFVEGNYLYLLLFAVGMGAFAFLRPSKQFLRKHYQLKGES
ncbi:MAG: hypothetical protein AAF985_01400 [Bacteroidota bacterium]